MHIIDILAILFTFAIHILLIITYFGWGTMVADLMKLNSPVRGSNTFNIWIGWAFSLLLFQILHLFLPLNALIVLPVFLIGILSTVRYLWIRKDKYDMKFTKLHFLMVFIFVIISLWVASHSMLNPYQYDSGLYHFNVIRWTNTFSIVPGLGNLHGRFAFNQSFFTYVAALNFFPYFNYGRSLANSFLFILTLLTTIEFLWPLIKNPSLSAKLHPYKYLPSLFTLPVLVLLAFSSSGFASPSPDLTSTLLQLLMFIVLANSIGEWIEGNLRQNSNAVYLAILAATAITIKLSNIAFSIIIFGIILLYLVKTYQLKSKTTLYIFIVSSAILFVFMLRGFILSGVPLYPSSVGYGLIPVDWAIPKESIINEANWVYSWARKSHTHWSNVLGNWNWFQPWFDNIVKHRFIDVLYPLILAILFFSIVFLLTIFKKIKKPNIVEALLVVPAIVSLVFWFFTAPTPRFANAIIFLLFLASFLFFLASVREYVSNKILFVMVGFVFIISNINLYQYIDKHPNSLMKLSTSGWYPPKKVPLVKKVTKSGLEIYTPKKGDQCWDSKIPCTPYFNKALKLRVKDYIESGFMLEQSSKKEKGKQ